MKSIYVINNEYLQLVDALIESGGEVTPELEQALQINKEELELKATNYAYFIKSLEDQNTSIDNEIKRLQAIKKTNSNLVERLEFNISNAMQIFEKDEIKTPTLKLIFRKSESVECLDVNALDKEYKRIKVTEEADKTKIKEALKDGVFIPGCRLVTNKNLQIK